MKPSEYIEFVNRIEAEYPVDEWVIDNIHVWPIIRVGLISFLDEFAKKYHSTGVLRNAWWVIKDAIYYPLSEILDRGNNLSLDQTSDAFFLTASSNRQMRVDGRYYDNLATPFITLLEERGLKSFVIEDGYRGDYRLPRYNKSMFIPPYLNYLAIKSIYLKKMERRTLQDLRDFDVFASLLQSVCRGLRYSHVLMLTKRVNLIRNWANYFKQLFERVRPRIGFVVCYYGPMGMSYNLACREYGIPSVDIQHGLQGEYNIAYGKWNRVPPEGYEVMPRYFWTWGEDEAAVINEWSGKAKGNHAAIAGGNLLLNEFQRGSDLSAHYDLKLSRLYDSSKKQILVSLQPVNGLSPLLVGAMKKAPDNWFWWIRMHPDMRSKRMKVHRLLQSLHRDNWSLFEATDLPLYSLLKVMDVHITEYSAVVLEAEMFGISSIITHPLGRDFFQRQIQRRMVFEAYHLEDLLSKIEETSRRRTPVMEEEKSHADELLAGLLAGERYMN